MSDLESLLSEEIGRLRRALADARRLLECGYITTAMAAIDAAMNPRSDVLTTTNEDEHVELPIDPNRP